MYRSLFSILDEESRLTKAIDVANGHAQVFQHELDRTRSIPIECGSKMEDLARYEGLVAKYHREADEYRQQLDAVRDDLRAYITDLFKNSTKGGNA